MSNQFLEFCPDGSEGVELPTNADYLASAIRTDGNVAGVANSKMNNKALRQANFITSQIAQLAADLTAADILDDGDEARMRCQLAAVMGAIPQVLRGYTTPGSSGTHNRVYAFFIATGTASATATYTNNGITYTVITTTSVLGVTAVLAIGSNVPTASGTLTKTGGTGSSTLTFYATRLPIMARIRLVGAGGGGAGAGIGSPGTGGTGGSSTFGTGTAAGGVGGAPAAVVGGIGGVPTPGTGWSGLVLAGSIGSAPTVSKGGGSGGLVGSGGNGGVSPLGGAGVGASHTAGPAAGLAAEDGTGSGGGGASGTETTSTAPGSGGGAGAYIEALFYGPAATYSYGVGTGGTAGAAGSGGAAGGAGGSGLIEVTELFQ